MLYIKETISGGYAGDKARQKHSWTLNEAEEMETEINKFNLKKATTFKNVSPKILKSNSDICSELFTILDFRSG